MSQRPDRPDGPGEVLRAAREARGLDLPSVERDTRIRQQFLSALERDAFDELPGGVYTTGFLRNYANYLGVDADPLVERYRSLVSADPRPVADASLRPRPGTVARPPTFLLTRSTITAALLTLLVGGLIAYLAYEIVTFARTPELRVLEPAGDVTGHPERTISIRGVTAPNAQVSVEGLRENPRVRADSAGSFALRVELVPGTNVVTLRAFDPVTSRTSPEVRRRIEVIEDGADGAGDGGESGDGRVRRGIWRQNLRSMS